MDEEVKERIKKLINGWRWSDRGIELETFDTLEDAILALVVDERDAARVEESRQWIQRCREEVAD